MFDRYHADISAALTDLGSALHISITSECQFRAGFELDIIFMFPQFIWCKVKIITEEVT